MRKNTPAALSEQLEIGCNVAKFLGSEIKEGVREGLRGIAKTLRRDDSTTDKPRGHLRVWDGF